MQKYIMALDQGTTSSRAIIFNKKGEIISTAQKEFKQHFPKSGWVEHDPHDVWSSQVSVATEALASKGLHASDIEAIGITNQRETVIVWDKQTGNPIYNAIVWQDKRTTDYCNSLKAEGHSDMIRNKTGLVIDSYFSATKVKWILDNVEGAREKAESGNLLMGTVDTWLIYNLTAKQIHITDVSNASRTLIYNINTLEWDQELLKLFTIPASMLPEVKPSSEVYANTSTSLFENPIPIAGIAGDQQAALFGQMCSKPGMVKNTYGTGCFMLMNIGESVSISKNNLLTTIGWKINGKTTYALEGSIFIAGAVVQWLRDGIKIIRESGEVENLAASVEDTDGLYFVPAFAGLGAPHWNQSAKGTIFGITRGTSRAHIAKASLESIAFQTMDILKAMEADSGISIKELRVDGGASVNDMLMQFQSEVLNIPTLRPKIVETTAMGAAFLAGLAVGYWENVKEINKIWKIDKTFKPKMDQDIIEGKIKGWYKAVEALQHWTTI